jgi:predicted nucleic acid-binding protein
MKVVVADAGPLIGLARVGRLGLLKDLYESITVPEKVLDEIAAAGRKPGAAIISENVRLGWIKVVPVNQSKSADRLRALVDVGEAEAIQLASEMAADLLLIDDKKGRKFAKKRGLAIIGTGGVLIKAKQAGRLETVAPVLSELSKEGYRLSMPLCRRILERAGESHPPKSL